MSRFVNMRKKDLPVAVEATPKYDFVFSFKIVKVSTDFVPEFIFLAQSL